MSIRGPGDFKRRTALALIASKNDLRLRLSGHSKPTTVRSSTVPTPNSGPQYHIDKRIGRLVKITPGRQVIEEFCADCRTFVFFKYHTKGICDRIRARKLERSRQQKAKFEQRYEPIKPLRIHPRISHRRNDNPAVPEKSETKSSGTSAPSSSSVPSINNGRNIYLLPRPSKHF